MAAPTTWKKDEYFYNEFTIKGRKLGAKANPTVSIYKETIPVQLFEGVDKPKKRPFYSLQEAFEFAELQIDSRKEELLVIAEEKRKRKYELSRKAIVQKNNSKKKINFKGITPVSKRGGKVGPKGGRMDFGGGFK